MPEDSRRPPSKRPGFDIRNACSADVDALQRLEAASFRSDRLSRRSLAALTKSPSAAFLVACRGATLLGYAVLLFRRGTKAARLYSIAVTADEAGRGVGSRLLSAAEDAARKRSAARLRLEVRADNPAAIRFYERRGYEQVGQRAGYYEDGMTALLFSRPLPRPASAAVPARRFRRAA
jgi:[ribosomal protein S18]-alanine N-acetyltransferase